MTSSNSSSQGGEQTRNPHPHHYHLPRWAWIGVLGLVIIAILSSVLFVIIIKRSPYPYGWTEAPMYDATLKKQEDMKKWKTYNSGENGLSFKYPASWGEPIVVNEKTYDESDPSYQSLSKNIKKQITPSKTVIYFSKVPSGPFKYSFFVDVIKYDKQTPLALDCMEGSCETQSIFEMKNEFETWGNVSVGGYRGITYDDFGMAYSLLVRDYRIVTLHYWFVFKGIFDSGKVGDDYNTFMSTWKNNAETISFENLLRKYPSEPFNEHLKSFLDILSNIIGSVKLSM